MARTIVLMTQNERKLAEYRRRFSLYGIDVEADDDQAIRDEQHLASRNVIAVMRETSNLYAPSGETCSVPRHLDVVVNRTELEVTRRSKDTGFARDRYVREIEGHIDMRRRAADASAVFSWDDIFVPKTTLRSYHQMRELGVKLSARDLVISDYVTEHLWYRNGVRLEWTPLDHERTVDFSVDPVAFVREHAIYGRLPADHFLRNVLEHVLGQGLFFRSAKSRREKNYWLPGLNAGVPMTPKRDHVHEATFMFHDLMHFGFPDLLFDGQSSAAHANTYVIHRMMSEAFTLVLADMIFIDELRENGVDYDFSERRIHPLLCSLSVRGSSVDELSLILYANARYCLAGDDAAYRELGASHEALKAFADKYEQFFVSDYRWTAQNFASMQHQMGTRAERWLALTGPLRATFEKEMLTVSDYVRTLEARSVDFDDRDALIEAVFADYLARLRSMMTTPVIDVGASCLERGFLRYMTGQMALFVVYDFLPESAHYAERLVTELVASPPRSPADVKRLRAFFDQHVDLLRDRSVINDDDCATFKELYPIFAPFYVAYDVDVTTTLAAISQTFGTSAS